MRKPKQKLLTFPNVFLLLLVICSTLGLALVWFIPFIGQALIWNSLVFLCWVVYFEVRGLKDWGEHNLEQLVKMAEVSTAAAYKIKQHGGKVIMNGKEM
ncbi:hypothetical protein [Pasteurella bettyae]|uniref:hypothetical protein n=1 Tax=Pasteurella bettyae TaxID=752 RepID=UPI003D2993C7